MMLRENMDFGLKKMRKQLSNSLYMIFGLAITAATIVLLYTIIVMNENPNNKFIHAERIIINNNTMRYKDSSDWGSSLNFRLIKEAIESIDFLAAKTIYNTSTHQRWVKDERYKSRILYTDHRMEKFINFQWIHGAFFSEEDLKNERRVILLSEKSAMNTFGTLDVMGKYCDVFDEKFRIIGVYKNIPEHTFSMDEIVPYTTDDRKDRETSIKSSDYGYSSLIMLKNEGDIPAVKQLIHENAKKFKVFPEGYKLALYPHTIKDQLYTDRKAIHKPWSYNTTEYNNFINSLILICILAIICFINVSNLTFTSFLNRNIEMGVRLSFGAKWPDILRQSLIESVLYFVFSFLTALVLSQLFITLLNKLEIYVNYTYRLNFDSVLILFVYTFFVPFFANILSSQKVLKDKPINLLKGVLA